MAEFIETILTGALILGALWALLGCGFGLIFGVTGRFHFAYATTFVLTVWIGSELISDGLPLYLGIIGGLLAGALIGVLIELLLYAPLVKRVPETALLAVFVTSLGVVIIGENFIRLVWGSDPVTISPGFTPDRLSLGGGVSITTLDVYTLVVSAVVIAITQVYISRSRFGRAIRAVQENTDMATAVGVNPGLVYATVFAIGSLMAGIGAMILAMRGALLPDGGETPTFTALVVVFLAGTRSSPVRFGIAGCVVGLIEQLASVYISSTWSPVVIFGVLFIFIALSPYFAVFRRYRAKIQFNGVRA